MDPPAGPLLLLLLLDDRLPGRGEPRLLLLLLLLLPAEAPVRPVFRAKLLKVATADAVVTAVRIDPVLPGLLLLLAAPLPNRLS